MEVKTLGMKKRVDGCFCSRARKREVEKNGEEEKRNGHWNGFRILLGHRKRRNERGGPINFVCNRPGRVDQGKWTVDIKSN